MRGKTGGIDRSAGSFQWTSAVKALCLLSIRTKLGQRCVSGETGSLASALDYALGKPPLWLTDIFGVGREGTPISSRLFLRTNPERKRPGPVSISFNPSHLTAEEIQISVAGAEVSAEELVVLSSSILSDKSGVRSRRKTLRPEHAQLPDSNRAVEFSHSAMERSIEEAVSKTLVARNIFFRSEIRKILNRISDIPRLQSARSFCLSQLNDFDQGLSGSLLRGISDDRQLKQELQQAPLHIAVTASQCSSLAIFQHMAEQHGACLDVHYAFTNGYDIVTAVADGTFREQPDLLCLGAGPAFDLLRSCPGEYQPLTIAPPALHKIVSHRNVASEDIRSGEYKVMAEEPTSLAVAFDSLCAEGLISESKTKIVPFDAGEMSLLLEDPDMGFHTLLWAPYSHFFARHTGARETDIRSNSEYQDTLILAHRRFFENSKRVLAFEVLFRQAWWALLHRPDKRKRLARKLSCDQHYLGTVSACLGLLQSH